MKLKAINTDTANVFNLLSMVEMFNIYCKSNEFKEHCVNHIEFGMETGKLSPLSSTYYRNKFYKMKNLIIIGLVKNCPELIDEWHIEDRHYYDKNDIDSYESFVLVSFLVNGRQFRFHQVRPESGRSDGLGTRSLPKDKKTKRMVYSHDTYKIDVDYDYSPHNMRMVYDSLKEMFE